MSKSDTKRDEQLVRAAHLRAAIIAHVGANPDTTSKDFVTSHDELLQACGASAMNVRAQFEHLYNSGQIKGTQKGRYWYYRLPSRQNAKAPATEQASTPQMADLKVQIVKSTGAVRLMFGGLKIEVSIAE